MIGLKKKLKNQAKGYFDTAKWFYEFLGIKIIIGFFLAMIAGILDGFGIAMFFPLLNSLAGQTTSEKSDSNFLTSIIESIGVELNFNVTLILMLVFFVGKALIRFINLYYRFDLLKGLLLQLRSDIFIKIRSLSFIKYQKLDSGKIQNVLTSDIDRLQYTYTYYFQTIEYGVITVVYLLFAYIIDFNFASLVTIGGVGINYFFKSIYQKTSKESDKLSRVNNKYFGNVNQFMSNIKYIRISGLYNKFLKRISHSIETLESTRKRISLLNSGLDAAREPSMIIIICTALFFQINYLNGSSEEVIITLVFFYRALTSVTLMQTAWNNFNSVRGSLKNIKSLQKGIINTPSLTGNNTLKSPIESITLKEVSLSISNKSILEQINIVLQKGKIYFLVGSSGGGKSSLLNVISRLYDDYSGEILISKAYDMKNYPPEEIQKSIGYLTQEAIIFEGNVFENVTLWAERNSVNETKAINCLIKASLIESFSPNELKILDKNANTLSGGQKQRINIARELYKDVDVLIFDEGTSALDPLNEQTIMNNLRELKNNYIILIVTHNQSNLDFGDEIIYLENGRVKGFDTLKNLKQHHTFFNQHD